jgi:hypothetical protein
VNDLIWLCGACSAPVGEWDGYLYASVHQAQRSLQAERDWRERHPAPLAVSAANITELLSAPGHAEWKVTHIRCGGEACPFDAYCLDPGDVATWQQLVKWTAHLMGKNWLAGTDWEEVLREASGEASSQRVRIERRAA